MRLSELVGLSLTELYRQQNELEQRIEKWKKFSNTPGVRTQIEACENQIEQIQRVIDSRESP